MDDVDHKSNVSEVEDDMDDDDFDYDDNDYDEEEEEDQEEEGEEEEEEDALHLFKDDLPQFEMGLLSNAFVGQVREARARYLRDYGTASARQLQQQREQDDKNALATITKSIEKQWDRILHQDDSSLGGDLTFDLGVLKRLLSPAQVDTADDAPGGEQPSSLQQQQREMIKRMRTDHWSYDVEEMLRGAVEKQW